MIVFRLGTDHGEPGTNLSRVAIETTTNPEVFTNGGIIPNEIWEPHLLSSDQKAVWDILLEDPDSQVIIIGSKVNTILFGWYLVDKDGNPINQGDTDVFYSQSSPDLKLSPNLDKAATVTEINHTFQRTEVETPQGHKFDISSVEIFREELLESIDLIGKKLISIAEVKGNSNLDDPGFTKLLEEYFKLKEQDFEDPVVVMASCSLFANQAVALSLSRKEDETYQLTVVDPNDFLQSPELNLQTQLDHLAKGWRDSPVAFVLKDNVGEDHTNIYQVYLDLFEYIEKSDTYYDIKIDERDLLFKRAINGLNIMIKHGIDHNVSFSFDENYLSQFRRINKIINTNEDIVSDSTREWFEKKTVESFGRTAAVDPILAYSYFFERFHLEGNIIGQDYLKYFRNEDGTPNEVISKRIRTVMLEQFNYGDSRISKAEERSYYKSFESKNPPKSINEIISVIAVVLNETYNVEIDKFVRDLSGNWSEISKERVSYMQYSMLPFTHDVDPKKIYALMTQIETTDNNYLQQIFSGWKENGKIQL
jgi:hypothetical protein